ncbi:hypothetical protein R1X32_17115 [Rhodococcus opacus]
MPSVVVEPQVTIPPELLEHLATPSNPYWWAQPAATLLAGLLALSAAGIAWWSVSRQIRANRDTSNRQLATQRYLHRQTVKADSEKQLRADRLAAVVDAAALVHELSEAAADVQFHLEYGDDHLKEQLEARSKAQLTVERLHIARSRLRFLDLRQSANAVWEFFDSVNGVMRAEHEDSEPALAMMDLQQANALVALHADLSGASFTPLVLDTEDVSAAEV